MDEKTGKSQFLKRTKSICPKCYAILDAQIFKENNQVWIEKTCKEHGTFKEIYWSDYDYYRRAELYRVDGSGVSNPKIKTDPDKIICPKNCGLCKLHKSHTLLGNIFLTNRCELNCWYCFAHAKRQGYVYEPTFEQVKFMLKTLRNNQPVPAYAVQFTGGEPTLRSDLVKIIKTAKKMGFLYILLNTNGLRIAKTHGLAKKYKEAGVNVLYLSFDGVSEKTNPKNHKYMEEILNEMRDAEISVTLVPTLVKGVNDHEIGAIIDFAMENIDIVRGVNFQPVSFVGRMERIEREQRRVTIPDLLGAIEEQTGGVIPMHSFYPIPVTVPISNFLESATGIPQSRMTPHPHCGAGTYVFKEGGKIVPVTDFMDVDALSALLNQSSAELKQKMIGRVKAVLDIHKNIDHCIDKTRLPNGVDIKSALLNILKEKTNSLGDFHKKVLFIGTMHFQDTYNYDIERVKRCVIHYVVPDGRIIPFCSYNVMPEIYRDRIHESYGIPIEEWKKQTHKELDELAQPIQGVGAAHGRKNI